MCDIADFIEGNRLFFIEAADLARARGILQDVGGEIPFPYADVSCPQGEP